MSIKRELNNCCSSPYLVKEFIDTAAGKIPQIDTSLVFRDILDAWKARWGINRMNYKVPPGLYAVGQPEQDSPVLVSANYKLSFDMLRKELAGQDAWVMIIDTKGINVWCAAGKGTFDTEEIVKRIDMVRLNRVVSHRTIILPQLAAPGVAAHEITRRTGFKVVYGPVRASDLPLFIKAGMKASHDMRQVNFSFKDRLVLTPIELVAAIKPLFLILAALFLLKVIKPWPLYTPDIITGTLTGFLPYLGATIIGCVIVPILLPWIPGRAFAWKGWLLGIFWAVFVYRFSGWAGIPITNWKLILANLLILPAISAFLALNFTGATTYTSLSGVKKEMKIALPAIIISVVLGVILVLADKVMEFI